MLAKTVNGVSARACFVRPPRIRTAKPSVGARKRQACIQAALSTGPSYYGNDSEHWSSNKPIVLPQPVAQATVAVMHAAAQLVHFVRVVTDALSSLPFWQSSQAVPKHLRGGLKRAASMAVMPLVQLARADNLTEVYTRTFEKAAFSFAKMYLFCLFMRVLLSWFPSIDWNVQPWAFLRLITEPYLQIYRGILPPLFGQLDFTPLVGFLLLQDVVEVMAPVYTMGTHRYDRSDMWTYSDVLHFFDGY